MGILFDVIELTNLHITNGNELRSVPWLDKTKRSRFLAL